MALGNVASSLVDSAAGLDWAPVGEEDREGIIASSKAHFLCFQCLAALGHRDVVESQSLSRQQATLFHLSKVAALGPCVGSTVTASHVGRPRSQDEIGPTPSDGEISSQDPLWNSCCPPVTITDLGLTFSQTWWLCFLHSLLPCPPGSLDNPGCTSSF